MSKTTVAEIRAEMWGRNAENRIALMFTDPPACAVYHADLAHKYAIIAADYGLTALRERSRDRLSALACLTVGD